MCFIRLATGKAEDCARRLAPIAYVLLLEAQYTENYYDFACHCNLLNFNPISMKSLGRRKCLFLMFKLVWTSPFAHRLWFYGNWPLRKAHPYFPLQCATTAATVRAGAVHLFKVCNQLGFFMKCKATYVGTWMEHERRLVVVCDQMTLIFGAKLANFRAKLTNLAKIKSSSLDSHVLLVCSSF